MKRLGLGLAWIVLPLLLAGVFVARDRSTLERGNRLFHGGRPAEAVDVYRRTLEEDSSSLVALYNLGTVLAETQEDGESIAEDGESVRSAGDAEYPGDVDSAESADAAPSAILYLEEAVARGDTLGSEGALHARDSVALQRSHYNLGTRYLGKMEPFLRLDSAFVFLSEAVSHNREALLLNPDDESARWNLAVAQRSLDSLLVQVAIVDDRDQEEVEALDGIEFDSGMLTRAESSRPDALPPPEGTRPDPDEDVAEDPSQAQASIDGAREALEGRDPGVIDRARALETLEGFSDNPELVVRGILWVQRPDVVWWDRTPYPGGDW